MEFKYIEGTKCISPWIVRGGQVWFFKNQVMRRFAETNKERDKYILKLISVLSVWNSGSCVERLIPSQVEPWILIAQQRQSYINQNKIKHFQPNFKNIIPVLKGGEGPVRTFVRQYAVHFFKVQNSKTTFRGFRWFELMKRIYSRKSFSLVNCLKDFFHMSPKPYFKLAKILEETKFVLKGPLTYLGIIRVN